MKRANQPGAYPTAPSSSNPPGTARSRSATQMWVRQAEGEEQRDQSPSPFKEILERLVRSVPGAVGAVVVDTEGESVDYAGSLPSFRTKLMGAHLRVVLDVGRSDSMAQTGPKQLLVRAGDASFLVRSLPHGYALALALTRRAFDVSPRALLNAEWEIAVEAGWRSASSRRAWYPVGVETVPRNRYRPARVRCGARWETLEVLGTVVGLHRERGYRCRLGTGIELTLLREPAGRWYADESPEQGK
jgi:predicted regulator of Ras-like GTPase activity (Roadblock/LC7/MglB family)